MYGPIGENAIFSWKYSGAYSQVEWIHANAGNNWMMFCKSPCNSQNKSSGYNIDYLNGDNSIGMVLHKVNASSIGQYSVKLTTDGNAVIQTSSELKVISGKLYQFTSI